MKKSNNNIKTFGKRNDAVYPKFYGDEILKIKQAADYSFQHLYEMKQGLIDLVGGIGIGLCFSKYWGVGILLIIISLITAQIELDNEKKQKTSQNRRKEKSK